MKLRPQRWATRLLLAGAIALTTTATSADELELVASVAAPTGVAEIVTYDPFTNQVFTTSGTAIDVYDFGAGSDLASASTIDLSSLFGGELDSISSVAIDPLGRGFGAALAIPNGNTTQLGLVVFFNAATGEVLNTLAVGYNPDMVTFTPDGSSILIANEGEASTDPDVGLDPEGSISIVNVEGVELAGLADLTNADIDTYNFAPANLADPTSLMGLRIDPRNFFNIPADLEPEYISVSDGKAYVALQENSAIAVFDLASRKWETILNIYGKNQVIDASDKDGIRIDDKVFGLYMPDAIATYGMGGTTYIVTANEGDARDGVEGEEQRIKDLGVAPSRFQRLLNRYFPDRFPLPEFEEGTVFIDRRTARKLKRKYGDFQADDALGRLRVTTLDGDTDGDGDIDRLTMYGTRSFSIFNAATGELVFDSGSDFEAITADDVPDLFNSEDNDPEEFDGRSDNKGPEPEGVAVATIAGRTYAAIGLERTGGIMLYDVTAPADAEFVQYINSAAQEGTGAFSPEGLAWITPDQSPDGNAYLVVSYEGSGTVEVFSFSPEAAPLDEDSEPVVLK